MYYEYSLVFCAAALLSWSAYAAWLFKNRMAKELLPSILAVLSVLALSQSGYLGQPTEMMLTISYGIALIASLLVQFYMIRPKLFIALTALMFAGFLLYHLNSSDFASIGFFGLSTMYGLVYREMSVKKRRAERNEKAKEVGRDVVQTALGVIVVILLLALWNLNARAGIAVWSVFVLIILGYAFNNLSGENRLRGVYRTVRLKLERSGAVYGAGALHLAAGAAIILGFVGSHAWANNAFLVFGMIVLFFGDSAATIVGMHFGSIKLPYNKRKSLAGAVAFFAVTALPGYLLIGPNALICALVLTFVESIETPVDDNVCLAIAVVLLSVLMPS